MFCCVSSGNNIDIAISHLLHALFFADDTYSSVGTVHEEVLNALILSFNVHLCFLKSNGDCQRVHYRLCCWVCW